jgi:hypothetical protein
MALEAHSQRQTFGKARKITDWFTASLQKASQTKSAETLSSEGVSTNCGTGAEELQTPSSEQRKRQNECERSPAPQGGTSDIDMSNELFAQNVVEGQSEVISIYSLDET